MILDKTEKLSEISFYQVHPELLPFVGEKYEKYRILHIGESHYINQTPATEVVTLEDFADWWGKPCAEVLRGSEGWTDTRNVVANYMSDKRGAYNIFTNVVKSFSEVVLDQPIKHIDAESKRLYSNFAFMNFFQMPSVYKGEKYWNSILRCAKRMGDTSFAYSTWDQCVKVSANVVDQVIDILQPRMVVFTSISAGNAYRETTTAVHPGVSMVYTSHPNTPYTWRKPLKSLQMQTGKAVFEQALQACYK